MEISDTYIQDTTKRKLKTYLMNTLGFPRIKMGKHLESMLSYFAIASLRENTFRLLADSDYKDSAMTAKKYTTRSGAIQYKPVLSANQARRMMFDSANEGFCLNCGKTQSGVEPDARQYECESCGKHKVYGIEELLLMGLVEIK